MATLISCATGNFTSSSTWALCDSTAELDSQANTVTVGTGNVDSQTFAPGAITVDGVAVKVSARTASPSTNTLTVTLRNSTDSVDVASVTCNVSDIHASAVQGWYFFKFSSSYLLVAGKNYIVRCAASAASMVTLYRDGTSNNVSRQLRTTTTQAPAAGDKLLAIGEVTGAGTSNSFTVTMDNTAATVFGNVSFTQSLCVGRFGTLAYGTSASTNYLLTIAGVMRVHTGGTFTMGTSGSRVPSTSTAVLQFSPSTTVDSGLYVDVGTVKVYGNQITNIWQLLTQDAAVSDDHIHIGSTTGWSANEELVIAPTGTSYSQGERKTISTVDSGTQVTLTATLSYGHTGTSPVQGEVIHITRNVRIEGASTSLNAYVNFAEAGSTIEFDSVVFRYLGSSTSGKRGTAIAGDPTSGAFFTYCVWTDCTAASAMGVYLGSAVDANVEVSHCVFYAVRGSAIASTAYGAGTALSISDCVCIGCGGTQEAVDLVTGCSITDLRVAGSYEAGGMGLLIDAGSGYSTVAFAVVDVDVHSTVAQGIQLGYFGAASTFSDLKVWYAGSMGLIFSAPVPYLDMDTVELFGNTINNIRFSDYACGVIKGLISDGSDAQATASGIYSLGNALLLTLVDCVFSGAVGVKAAHTYDIELSGDLQHRHEILADKCILNASTPINNADSSQMGPGSYIRIQYVDGSGNHKSWFRSGHIRNDAAIYKTATPSERCTPNNASLKLESGPFRKPVDSGNTATFTVWTRKSASGDSGGADYGGAHQRLILKRNYAAGITADVVLDTAAAAVGNWEVLTGTTAAVSADCVLEAVVDCDGTVGWVNVDDWS